MGCSASKQAYGRTSDQQLSSWYAPLPRSASARPYTQQPPCEPQQQHGSYGFEIEDGPSITGDFIGALQKKRLPVLSLRDHVIRQCSIPRSNSCHDQYPLTECLEASKSGFYSKRPNATGTNDLSRKCTAGDDQPVVLPQQNSIKKIGGIYRSKHRSAQSSPNDDEHYAPSYHIYLNNLSSQNDFPLEPMAYENDCDGDTENMQIMEHGSSGRHGVPRRKSRFAPRGSKIHHIRTKSSEILQRFNLPRDDCCTAESGSHRSPETGTWEGGLTSKRRKNSLDLSVSSPILDGLEGHPRHNFCTFSTVAENPPTTAFLEQESPMDIDTRFESNNCADSSAFNEVIPGGSQRIADSTNPGSRSPEKSHVKTPSSPLFDPSILAAFEEAIESVRCSDLDDTWMLDSDNSNEPSSFSSGKFTWNSSEASSDEENGGRSNELFGNALDDSSHVGFPREIGDQVKRQKIDIAYTGLQQFELRCPPKGEDKVVLYFTSMRGVRRTYKDCCTLRNILQGLHVEVDERDVWMHCKFKEELADLLGEWAFPVPRLFIKGRYIGGIEEVEQLNDDGVLTKLVEDLPKLGKSRKTCEGCADVRFIPCLTCSGSRKHLDDEIDKIVPCFECNENGLIMCPLCRK